MLKYFTEKRHKNHRMGKGGDSRLWEFEAERVLVSSSVKDRQALLRVLIVWKNRKENSKYMHTIPGTCFTSSLLKSQTQRERERLRGREREREKHSSILL